MSADDEDTRDEIKIGPEIAPGVSLALRRSPDGTVKEVACQPFREGAPLYESSEIVTIDREHRDGWRKLTTRYKAAGDGPAQVATPAYRDGYDRIFGKKQKVGLA